MKSKKRTIKYWIGQLHLWLGLASGIVVLIVSLTGCIFAFQAEISKWVYKDKLFVTPPSPHAQPLPVSTLFQKAQQVLTNAVPAQNITTYKDPTRAWEVMAFAAGDPNAITFRQSIKYYRSVHINPYTGAITGQTDYTREFFIVVKYIHWSLLLSTPYGQPIIGWSTCIFVILLITGLILWWPKKWNKRMREQSFKIKWSAKFKRLNYDLHNVLGFYSMLVALVIAFTGLIFAFKWFSTLAYATASLSLTPPPPPPPTLQSTPIPSRAGNPMDMAYTATVARFPAAERIGLSPAFGPEGTVYVYAYRDKNTYYNRDELQYDQYSGKMLRLDDGSKKNNGEKLIDMNYDIHVGAVAGLPGKIIAFITSLICASLPITGFYVWWNKRKSQKHKPARINPATALSIQQKSFV